MRILLTAIILMVTSAAIAQEADTLKLEVNQNQFMVSLPSNPTTGFQWTVINYDKSFLQLVKSQYLAPETKLVGSWGQMQFNFKLIAGKKHPSKTTMLFKYYRTWEPESATLKTVVVTFK